MPILSIREQQPGDNEFIVDYFLNLHEADLQRMGIDKTKYPSRTAWLEIIERNRIRPFAEKEFYYVIWMANDDAIGHSNINKIVFGDHAYMHLHIWDREYRHSGIANELLPISIEKYFRHFELKQLFSEPAADNPAPNRALEKAGFELTGSYEAIPGWINTLQKVNRWVLKKDHA